jgi:hypothetical protein
MNKRIWLFLLGIISGFAGFSQPYGNEWIQYNTQSYFKLYVNQEGIYRISYSTLNSSGFPVGSTDPRSYQIFYAGQEQYIYIKGENDGIFNTDDYIEFYGKPNTGWYDLELYHNLSNQANTNYSLFNDSSAYFITWNPVSINNRRLTSETDQSFGSYGPAATWFYKVVREDYTSDYLGGGITSYGLTDPEFTAGEGWYDTPFSLGGSTSKTLNTPNRYFTGPDAQIDFTIVGASNYALLYPDHHVTIQFAGQTIDTTYEGYGIFRFHRNINESQINNTTGFVFTSLNNIGSGADRNAVAFIQVKYAHNTNLENASTFHFWLLDGLYSKTYLSLTALNATAGDSVRFYDLTNHRRIRTNWDGTTLKALVPNSGSEKECYLVPDAQIRTVTKLYSVGPGNKFVDYRTLANTGSANYYILTHSSLMTEAQQYKAYRDIKYNSLIIDVDNLWDQYAYGILKDPLAIKHFMHEAYNTYNTKPEYLFIIGKGYRAGHEGVYPSYRKDPVHFNLTLIPSLGNPPSDYLFTNGILDTLYMPAVATGRLAARNSDHVTWYLDKVMQYESAQLFPQEWMKNVLHFGGGNNSGDQALYAGYLNQYKAIIEDTLFGGYVRTYLKTSTLPIQLNLSDSLKDIINNGVTLLTFFGHAAGIGFDISIDNPDEYTNYGKYPFLLANSCYAGDLFLDDPISSEAFVLIKEKGTIGYLASVSLGIPYALNNYSTEFYKNIGYKSYGMPVGTCIQRTIQTVQEGNEVVKECCLEMLLHGDPAVILNSFAKPDYMINSANVYFDPPDVTSEIDSFNVNVISTNLGRAISDSFIIRVVRVLPSGDTSTTYFTKIKATLFKDTILFKMPVDLANGIGMNKFEITLDFYDEIDELNEGNNSTEVTLLIKSTDIVPVWPYKYAVIPQLSVTLKASTGYAFLPPHNYVFELDTTDEFNSPIKQHYTVNHGGGVVTWDPFFPIMDDSIVYFWRVSPDSLEFGNYNWRESSFQYINGKRGWGQAHFFQFKNDDYEYVTYKKSQRKFEFVNNILSLYCQTGVYPNIPWNEEWYKLNGALKYSWAWMGPGGNGIILAEFDSISGQPLYSGGAYEFSMADTNSMNALSDTINAIPLGNYVLAYSHRNHYAENWTESLYQSFESFGSGNIRSVLNNHPYIIFGKKGDAIGGANEVVGADQYAIIQLHDSIATKWTQGYVLSEMIGPAIQWNSLHWRQRSSEGTVSTDSVRLSVIAYTITGNADTVIQDLPVDSGDIYNLWSRIDAATHPYLKLIAYMKDDSLHTPSQMVRWQVLFDGGPETALDPSQYYYFYKDTVPEGQTIHFATATHNISEYDMDSLLIKYWVVDNDRVIHQKGSFRHRPHPAGDILIDSISFSTTGLTGLNSLWIEVNPDNDQLEQYHFNNIGEVYFYVDKDITNPILDVTFDGVHILDGDIVSAKPEIQVMLKDENKFLLMNDTGDTTHFKVWLIHPNSTTLERIKFGDQSVLQFVAASSSENRAHLLYHPEFAEDGIYHLLIQAEDKSKNESGDVDYEISFEVINKPSITAVMNWPNPFSTATHFVFTLTGSEVPSFFMIQIMTITGKVVKEIRMDELGPIHVGRNITDYAWDGTDMFGDRLANGVYLYRVITRLGENEIEKLATPADQYFTKSFGKMYLIR